MTDLAEMLKGLTDIPIALLAGIFGILLHKKESKKWAFLFFLICVSGILGALVHTFEMPKLLKNVLWIILYVFLFELIRRFAKLVADYVSGKEEKEKIWVYISEIFLYAVTVIWMFAVEKINDIFIFIIFAFIMFVKIVVCLLKCEKVPNKLKLLMIMLFFPIILQALCNVIPYAVVFEHIFLAVALYVAYSIGTSTSKVGEL